MKAWIKRNWIWVILPLLAIVGMVITPKELVYIAPYAFILLALAAKGAQALKWW